MTIRLAILKFAEKLQMVERAEDLFRAKNFKQFRVRLHNNLARIEILPADFEKLLNLREEIISAFKNYGFDYVSLDLQSYRSGSMNTEIVSSKK